jgi:FKBP-type peptidyl-prolyl cis-trans isomerase
MNSKVLLLSIIAFAVIFSACNDNSQEKQREKELELLSNYIDKNHSGLTPKKSGLYFVELKKGLGDTIKVGDKVQLFYKTMTIDEVMVDESKGYSEGYRFEPYSFVVGSNTSIKGLEEGVTYMTTGSKAKLIIPSQIAYGTSGSGSVGPFATLIMEVEMYKVFHK